MRAKSFRTIYFVNKIPVFYAIPQNILRSDCGFWGNGCSPNGARIFGLGNLCGTVILTLLPVVPRKPCLPDGTDLLRMLYVLSTVLTLLKNAQCF